MGGVGGRRLPSGEPRSRGKTLRVVARALPTYDAAVPTNLHSSTLRIVVIFGTRLAKRVRCGRPFGGLRGCPTGGLPGSGGQGLPFVRARERGLRVSPGGPQGVPGHGYGTLRKP